MASLIVFALLFTSCFRCDSTGLPAQVTQEQIQLVNRSIEALHEEVAAARSPRSGVVTLVIVSLVIPVLLAGWLLVRAERSMIGMDEAIRTLMWAGAEERIVRHYLRLESQAPALPSNQPTTQTLLPMRRRRERRTKRQSKNDDQREPVFSESPPRENFNGQT